MMTAAPALAGRGWCRADPIVSFDGSEVQIWVEMPAEYEAYVNGPIEVTMRHPKGVETEVLFTDSGFNGYGEVVNFKKNGWGNSACVNCAEASADAFPVDFEASVSLDAKSLKKDLGVKAKDVPLRLAIVDSTGQEYMVEATNKGTRLTVMMEPAK